MRPCRSEAGTPEARTSKPLLLIHAEIPHRYQAIVRLAPLLTEAIPPGQRHNEVLNLPYSWSPFSQLLVRSLLMILRKALEWMSERMISLMICDAGPFTFDFRDIGCLVLLFPLLSDNHRSLVRHDSHERENCCCCYLIASWYVRKALKAFVNTKLILIKRLAKDEIQHEIS